VIGAGNHQWPRGECLQCDHRGPPKTVGDRPDFTIELAAGSEDGVILPMVEAIGGLGDRHAQ